MYTWIDYQKAFDSVPHSWIIKSLKLSSINNEIISFTKKAMSYWKTSVCLHTKGKITETEDLEIQHGIFEEDSLSPVLFGSSLIPLIEQLNKLNIGCEEHNKNSSITFTLHG